MRALFARAVVIFVSAACLLTLNLSGQVVSGNIIGTVTDPSGSAVGEAAVLVANVGTSVATQTTTNESGNYTVPNLSAGPYTVTVTKPGFQKFIQQNVNVAVGQSARVDAALTVGETTQEIKVSS